MTDLIFSAVSGNNLRSLPKKLTEFWPFALEAASSTLLDMVLNVCEKLNSILGKAFSGSQKGSWSKISLAGPPLMLRL